MKVAYPIEYRENADPPPRRLGMIPRWKDVTDKLEDLMENGGVITIHVPRKGVKKEIKSLRNAILRARKKQGLLDHSFSVHIGENGGIKVWYRGLVERDEDENEPFTKREDHHE